MKKVAKTLVALERKRERHLKKQLKSEKGSITIFVLTIMLFMLIVVFSVYINKANQVNSELEKIGSLQEEYNADQTIDEIYNKAEDEVNKATLSISLYKKSGERYFVDQWTNEDLKVIVNYTGGDKNTKLRFFIDGEEVTYKDNYEITKNCTIRAEYDDEYEEVEITRIDKDNPTVAISPNGGIGYVIPSDGNAKIKATLKATDNQSGLGTLQYSWSNSNKEEPTNWETFSNGEPVEKEDCDTGIYYLWTKVVDNAGNRAETIKVSNSFIVNKNNTDKTNTITLTPDTEDWTNGNVTVTVEYGSYLTQNRKAGFGTANSENATKVVVEKNGTVYAEAEDLAGNKVTAELEIKNIDKEKPEITKITNPSNGNWTNENVTVTLEGVDNESGIKEFQWYENGSWTTRALTTEGNKGSITYTADRNLTIKYRVIDKVGNISEEKETSVKIDKTAPSGAKAEIRNVTTTGYDVYVTGVTDDGSGINRVQVPTWTDNNGQDDLIKDWTTNNKVSATKQSDGTTWVFHVNTSEHNFEYGKYYSHVYIYDNLGNSRGAITTTVTVPGVEITYDYGDGKLEKTTKGAGGKIGALPTASKEGYTFTGWYTEEDGGEKISENTVVPTSNVTYYARYTINSYNIDLNLVVDGTKYTSGYNKRVKVGLKVADVNKGYVEDFEGSYQYGTSYEIYGLELDGTRITYSKKGTLGAANLSLDVELYTLTINVNNSNYGSVSLSNLLVPKGNTYSTNSNVLTLSDGRKVTASTKTVTGNTSKFSSWSSTSGTINAATTVTANFVTSANTYTATFDSNGGSEANPKTISKTYGAQLGTLPTTSKTGYTFAGWYTEKSGGTKISEATTMPGNNVTYYAHWTANTYTVNYYNGGTKLGSSTHTYGTAKALTTISVLGGTQSGYTFNGWTTGTNTLTRTYTDGQSVNNLTSSANGTVNLYAIWQRTANFYSGTSKASKATATQYYNPKGGNYTVTTPGSITSISGWTALGWRDDTTAGAKEISAGAASTSSVNEFYAVYSRTVSLSYNANGGSGTTISNSTATQYYNTNGGITTPSFTLKSNTYTKTGYTFSKWAAGSTGGTQYGAGATYNGFIPGVNAEATQNMYAIWTVNQYYIDLNFNVDDKTYGSGGYNDRVYIGLRIGGEDKGYVEDYYQQHSYGTKWEVYGAKLDGTIVPYSMSGTVGAGNVNIKPEFYTMTFNVNNSSYGSVSPSNLLVPKGNTYSTSSNILTLSDGRKVTASTKTVTGNTSKFSSWSSASGTINAATTVTANFVTSVNTYTATFDSNGGSEANPKTISKTYGAQLGTLPTTSKTGYTFAGWYTEKSGGTKISEATTMPGNNVTYYAHWTANTYTVNYYNGGTKLGSSTHTYGTAKNLTTISTLGGTQSGYTFNGWTTGTNTLTRTYTDGQSVNNLTSSANGTVNLYAIWQRTANFYSGASKANKSTATQYYNPKGGNYTVTTPGSITSISGWTTLGWRDDTTAGDKEISAGAATTSSSNNFYAVYSRTANFYSGIGKGTKATATQYYNSNNAYQVTTSGTITAISGWTALGWRDDTTAGGSEYAKSTSITSSSADFYAVYSRTVNLAYNANGGSGTTISNSTATQYYNTNGGITTPSFTLKSNTYTKTGYTFSKWAAGSTGGTQYGAGATYNGFTPGVSAGATQNMYAIWTINSYKIDLNLKIDGTYYYSGYNGRVKARLKVAGVDKGYVEDFGQTCQYGTSYEIYGLELDGTRITYSKKGTLGAANLSLDVELYTLTMKVNNSSYGSVTPANLLVPKGNTYSTSSNVLTLSDGRKVTASTKTVTGNTSKFSSWSPASGTINAATTVTANFVTSVNTYTATFDSNGGSEASPKTISKTYGAQLGTLPTTSKTGYKFAGWYTSKTGGTKISEATTMPGNNVTYYAHWTANTYTVNYYNGGTKLGSSTYTYGTAKNLTTISTLGGAQSGYTFNGWTTGTNTLTRTYTDGQSVNNLISSANGTVNLYAIWQRTANFYSGASKASKLTATQYYNPKGGNYTVTTPSSITSISGWTTLGWRDDTSAGGKEISAGAASTSSSNNFYAVYSRTANFYSGTSKASKTTATQYYNSNNSYALTTPSSITSISGWTTLGWRDDTTAGAKEISAGGTTTLSANNFYAVYSRTANFYSGIGKGTKATATQYYNSNNAYQVTTSGTITAISGWTALGWRDDTSAGGSEYAKGTSLTTSANNFYAVYSRTVSLSYNANGGSGTTISNSTSTQYYNTNGGITTPSFTLKSNTYTKTGYTFSKWAAGSTGGTQYAAGTTYNGFTPGVSAGARQTMYAIWAANSYTIAFNGNGATSGSMSSMSMKYGVAKNLTSNAFAKTGYTFTGWKDDSGRTYTNGQSVSNLTSTANGKVTLYAQWKVNTYTVEYNANGGTGTTASSTHTYGVAKKLTKNGFTRTGYTFLGWSKDKNATSATYTNEQSVTNLSSTNGAKVILYAIWKKTSYTITYNANGGSGTMPKDTITYGASYTVKANTFTRQGYVFTGWNEKADGSGTSWTSNIGKTITWNYTRNITLYAQWRTVVAPEFDTKVINVTDTTFDVVVYNIVVPTGVKDVQVQAYSAQNGEDDNKWVHATKQDDGTYIVHVDRTTWKNGGIADSGLWWIRAWVQDNNLKETYGEWCETNLKGWGPWIPGKWQVLWNNGSYEIQVFWSYRQDAYANQSEICLEQLSCGSITPYDSYWNNYPTTELGIAGVGDVWNYTTASPSITINPQTWWTWDNPDIYTTVTHNADGSWPNPPGQFMWKANIGGASPTPEIGWTNFYVSVPAIVK